MTTAREALVVGGGLAGAAVAAALARRGWAVVVVDAPGGASAVPAAVMAPPPLPGDDPVTALRRRGAAVTRAWLRHLERRGRDCGRLGDGIVLLPRRAHQRRRWARLPGSGPGPLWLEAERTPEYAGVALPGAAVFHPGGLWLQPASLCAALRATPGVESAGPARVRRLARRGDSWLALGPDREVLARAPVAVVAAGMDSVPLVPATLPLIPARGQVTAIAPAGPVRALRRALSCGGYVIPAQRDRAWLGATLERHRSDPRPDPADDARNLQRYAELWPGAPAPHVVGHFAAARATTRDRLPLAGPVAAGLWLSAGHGTQGLLSAPLAALVLVEAIDRGHRHALADRLDPRRASVRQRTVAGPA